MGVDVVGVEYSGYGAAPGSPSVRTAEANALAAYEHLIAKGVLPEHVVVYGHSVGSGPACRFATSRKVGGLVLHAPITSAVKAIERTEGCCRPSLFFCCCDVFRNHELLQTVSCPSLVIHGRCDVLVPCSHGERLEQAIPEEHRWPGFFPEQSGHSTIEKSEKPAYFRCLRNFLDGAALRTSVALQHPDDTGLAAGFEGSPAGFARVPLGPEMV
uniref:Serine aminopeptidase S33 domain-containing protein n=1 Tax=Pyrodinium bahamense TaxID=73915 RepID=A0A7S0B7G6_9DINO